MQHDTYSAREITQYLLDKTGRAFLTGDFDAFQSSIALPYKLETFDGQSQVKTVEELHKLFQAVRAHHRNTNVTDMARHVVEAVFKDENTLVATYETRLLNGTRLTQEPYPAFAVVIREDGQWKAKNMSFAIEDSPEHNALLMSAGDRTGSAT